MRTKRVWTKRVWTKRVFTALLPVFLLPGCSGGSVNLWPFGEPRAVESDRKPANATEYQCPGSRPIYVRNLDDGAVWLIAPDREIRLEKSATAGAYTAGKVRLEISPQGATLFDPPAQFIGCKRAEAK